MNKINSAADFLLSFKANEALRWIRFKFDPTNFVSIKIYKNGKNNNRPNKTASCSETKLDNKIKKFECFDNIKV